MMELTYPKETFLISFSFFSVMLHKSCLIIPPSKHLYFKNLVNRDKS